MGNDTLRFATANGDTTAYVAVPENGNGKAVLVIQEWWGLNDHVKDIADRLAAEGFLAAAPDLYRGRIAISAEEASRMMHGLAIEDGIDTIRNAAAAVRDKYRPSGLGIIGFCMGGTFALRAACVLDDLSAAAPFYGDIPEEGVLKELTTPVMFVSGTRDGWITPAKVAELERIAEKYSLPVRSLKYDADHAFFNNTRPEVYDGSSAKDAWKRVIDFFNETI